jgi:hypothetical protein
LYLYGGTAGLPISDLWDANVDCIADAVDPLVAAGVTAVTGGMGDRRSLTPPAKKLLEICMLGYKGGRLGDFRVDYPSVFVVMPYREPWEGLYSSAIEPAALQAGLTCIRADRTVRIGDLQDNVWSQLAAAGLVLADISDRNPNVFYELGIAAAMGKDIMFLKDKRRKDVPVDLGGALYYEYDASRTQELKEVLAGALSGWASARRVQEVASLHAPPRAGV